MSAFVINKGIEGMGGTGLPFFTSDSLNTVGQGCCYYNNPIYPSIEVFMRLQVTSN